MQKNVCNTSHIRIQATILYFFMFLVTICDLFLKHAPSEYGDFYIYVDIVLILFIIFLFHLIIIKFLFYDLTLLFTLILMNYEKKKTQTSCIVL